MFDEMNEIPTALRDAEINPLCHSLVGLTPQEMGLVLSNYTNVDWLFIPQDNSLLLEIEGEQRRESKRKHYSIEIAPQ
jgi:hypothetical protein